MTKHVIISDLHPDASTAGFPRFGDVEKAMFEAADYANENEADTFIFAGDLITNDPSIDLTLRCVDLLFRTLDRLNKGIRRCLIPGNHDVFEDGLGTTVLDLFERDYWLYKEPDMHEGIVFFPFTPSSHRYDPSEMCEQMRLDAMDQDVRLVVGHLNLEGINVGSEYNDFPRGREVFFPIEEAKRCFPNAVLCNGHIHRRQVHRGVHVIGSIVPLTKTEASNEPGFLVIDV